MKKSNLTVLLKITEIVLMILSIVFFYIESVVGLLVILFLMGVQSTFFGPIKYSLLPEQLHKNELISGNGWIENGTFIAILLGTIFGSIVIGLKNSLLIYGIFIIIFSVIGFISSKFILKTKINDKNIKININVLMSTMQVIRYSKKTKIVWINILLISWFWFLGISFLTQIPLYSKQIIGGSEQIIMFFIAIFTTGIAIGSMLCNSILNAKISNRLFAFNALGITISILVFFISTQFYKWQLSFLTTSNNQLFDLISFLSFNISSWFIVLGLFSMAIFFGLIMVPLYSIMQYKSDKKYISRIISANNILNALFMVIFGNICFSAI